VETELSNKWVIFQKRRNIENNVESGQGGLFDDIRPFKAVVTLMELYGPSRNLVMAHFWFFDYVWASFYTMDFKRAPRLTAKT
jgi:hypothetical protein